MNARKQLKEVVPVIAAFTGMILACQAEGPIQTHVMDTGDTATAPPIPWTEFEYTLVGEVYAIDSVQQSSTGQARVRLRDATWSPPTTMDIVTLMTSDSTPVFRITAGGSAVRIRAREISVSSQVKVGTGGSVARSDPPQIGAGRIDVLPGEMP